MDAFLRDKLNIYEETAHESAQSILSRIENSAVLQEWGLRNTTPEVWWCCSLFVAAYTHRNHKKVTKPAAIASPHSAKTASSDVKTDPFRGLSLTSVLLNCDTKSVNFVDFAEKLKIIVRALFNEDESLLMLVQEIGGSFCVTKAVFKKYLDSWARHKTSFGGQGALGYTANNDDSASLMMPFDADIDEKAEKNAECSRLNRYKFEMGWFLYLRTKKALNIAGTDLAQSYYIMIASFVFLLEHAYNNDNENSESSQSSNNLTDMQEGPVAAALIALRKPSDKSSSGGILLESVARENNLSPAHVSKVRAMLRHVENAVTNIIEEVRTREARVASSNGDGIDSAGVKEVSDDEVRLDEASTGQQYKSIFSSERLQTIVRILKSEFQHISMKSLLFLDELWVLGNNSRQGQVMGVPLVSNSIKSTESGPPVRPTTPPAHSRSTFSLQDAGDASAHMDSAHSGRPPRSPYSSSSVRASHAPSTSGGSAPLVGMFGGSMPSSPYGLFSTPGGASTPTSSILGGAATALRSSPAQTPITSAMESSQWLYQLNQLSADPGPTMEKYFVDAGIISTMQSNLRNDIVARPERLLSKLDAPGHEEVRVQSRALYWRALVQLLDKESARLGVTAHSNLLGSESFHKALLSCATETVLKANSLITLTFPKILETFNISAIDFFKVLESFVSVTHNLPTALRRHLNRVHEMILEQYAWVSNSPLFAMIHKQKEQNLWPIDSLAPPTSLSEDDDAAIAPPAAGGRPSGDKSLVMLFDKLLALCSVLIYDLSHALGEQLLEDLPLTCSIDGKATGPCVKDQIYATLKACLADHYYTLCRNRSILHIVLCTFYGVCKVNKLQHEVKFQVIIQTYKELLRGSSAENIVHQIPLVDDVRGDIIQFYNTVYLPTMKQHLISVSTMALKPMPLPRNMEHAQSLGMTGQRLGGTNVFVSNSANTSFSPSSGFGRPPRFPNLTHNAGGSGIDMGGSEISRYSMTPTTKALYAFGESPSKDLELINRAINGKRGDSVRQIPNLGEQLKNATDNAEGADGRLRQIHRKRSRATLVAAGASQEADESTMSLSRRKQ